MSHEIRTPMTAILGFSRLLRERVEDSESNRFVENMISSGEHLLDLINDVLDISRIEAGRLQLHPEAMDIARLTEEIAQLFGPLAEEKGLELTWEKHGLPPAVKLDRQRVRQIITNLLGNAVKFTQDGSVHLEVCALDDQSGIRILVRDTGPGISEQLQKKIFEPFYQAGAAKEGAAGTGLGLAITTRLVQEMGGTIELESKPGLGSTFMALLPCEYLDETARAEVIERESGPAEAATEPLKILVADDHEPNRLLIDHILRSRGHEVVLVNNGREAVDAFLTQAFDRLILDVQMPVMGGFEAMRHIRSSEGGDRVPIMTLTAFAMRGDRLKSLEAGADDYLAKPFEPDGLVEKVEGLKRAAVMTTADQAEQREGEDDTAGEPQTTKSGEDPALLELKAMYLDSLVGEIADEIERDSFDDQLKSFAHRVAGSGGSFGFPKLTELARSIEHLEEDNPEFRRTALREIKEFAVKQRETLARDLNG
jgi:CheY-like chemotaxis protein/anti-sigma regulatory factor (Ser/Thr protein kinase)